MAKFLSELYTKDNDGFPFTVVRELVYVSDVLKRTITVPRGFQTDLASIPWFLWAVIPPVGRYDRAAVVHDLLYRRNGCTQKQADMVIYEAMGVLKVVRWRQEAIYWGLRLGGWYTWRKYRKVNKTK